MSASIGYGELTEIRRNAGLIVEACRSIKAGEPFESTDKPDLDAGRNLLFIETPDDMCTLDMLDTVLRSMKRFDPVWQTQVLVPLNKKSRLAREPVNERLRGLLNPGDERLVFRPNDKVICLRNSRVAPHAPDPGRVRWEQPIEGPRHYLPAGEEEFLANGETGRVLCVDHQWAIVCFRDDQPGDELTAKIWLPKKRRGEERDGEEGAADNFDLAYAVTVHKAQGSEAPCVIVLIDDAGGRVAGREWLYTAVSRAAKLCILIGKRDTAMKQIRQVALDKRKTFLVELLKEAGH